VVGVFPELAAFEATAVGLVIEGLQAAEGGEDVIHELG
jgi:hypothetical protein